MLGNAEMSIIAFLRKCRRRQRRCWWCATSPPCRAAIFWWAFRSARIWREIINTDAREYGGSGWGNLGAVESAPVGAHGRLESVNLTLPPLATIVLRWEAHA